MHGFLAEDGFGFVADDSGGEGFAIDRFLGTGGPRSDLADAEFFDGVVLEAFAHQLDRIDWPDGSGGGGCGEGCGFCRWCFGGGGFRFRLGGRFRWCRAERHLRELFDQVGFIYWQDDLVFCVFDEELDIGRSDFDWLMLAAWGEIDDEVGAGVLEWHGGEDGDFLGQLVRAECGEIDIWQAAVEDFVAYAIGDAGDGEAKIGFEFVTEVGCGSDDGNRDEMFHGWVGRWRNFSRWQTRDGRGLWRNWIFVNSGGVADRCGFGFRDAMR